MLVVCPSCGARYDFPEETVPDTGMHARCARCASVIYIARPDALLPDPTMTPAVFDDVDLSGPEGTLAGTDTPLPAADLGDEQEAERSLDDPMASDEHDEDDGAFGLPAGAPRNPRHGAGPGPDPHGFVSRGGAADPRGVRVGGRRPEPSTLGVHVSHREEREVESEPSVVIELGAFATDKPVDESAPTAQVRLAQDFSPLATPGLVAAAATPAPTPRGAEALVVREELDDVEVVRPPSIAGLMVFLLLVAVAGFGAFVWVRNDRGPVWEDPGRAIRVAFGVEARARPEAPPAPPVATEVAPVQGELRVEGVTLATIEPRGALVTGTLVNATNRVQTAITIEAKLLRDGVAHARRVVACCDALDPAGARDLLSKPDHAHFAEGRFQNLDKVRVSPGERRAFAVVFRELGTTRDFAPEARVNFSEVVSIR